MNYQFKSLERIFSALLFAANDHKKFQELRITFEEELEIVKKVFKELYFQSHPDQSFRNMVEVHHESLIEMIDTLTNHLDIQRTKRRLRPEVFTDEELFLTFLSVYNHLNGMLEFFHTWFEHFIPKNKLIPRLSLHSFKMEVKERKIFIRQKLSEGKYLLGSHLLRPFIYFTNKRNDATWHNLFYCKALAREFTFIVESKESFTDDDLFWLLYTTNYNCRSYYKAASKYIMELDPENYRDCLLHFNRLMRQAVVIPNLAYQTDYPALSTMLQTWVDEELKYINEAAQYRLPIAVERKEKVDSTSEKIFSALSVAELAYLYKMLFEIKAVKIDNHKEFFRTLARTYRTSNSENISSESLRSKFYKPEESVKLTLKNRIIKILSEINSDLN